MNYEDWTEEQKGAYVLEALSRKDLSAELAELIQGWIVCGKGEDGQEGVMDAILDHMFNGQDSKPSTRTVEALANLHEILRLPKVDAVVVAKNTTAKTTKRFPLRYVLPRVAAMAIPLVIMAGVLLYTSRPAVEPALPISMVEVGTGENGMVRLPCGSTVRLLDGSRMMAAENFAENRLVSLSGEAFFSVVRNEQKPFSVEANGLTVNVLGTEFHLKSWHDRPEKVVSLVTGSVEIGYGDKSVVLAPMEQLIYDEATGEARVLPFVPEQIDRWRSKRRKLEALSLEEALDAVGDFYGQKVVIEGDLPDDLGVSAVLTEQATVESVLMAFRLMHDIFDYTIQGGTIYIVEKK